MSEQEHSSGLSVADKLGEDQIDKIYERDILENGNPIEEIKNRVAQQDSSQSGLGISRIPVEAKEEFLELAQSKFCDDYGMTLAFLVDYFKANEGRREAMSEVLNQLDELRDEVSGQ